MRPRLPEILQRGRSGYFPVNLDPSLGVGHVFLRQVTRCPQRYGHLWPWYYLFSSEPPHCDFEEPAIHLVADRAYMAVLVRPEDITCSPYLQVPHGDLESCAEFREFPYRLQPFLGGRVNGTPFRKEQVGVCTMPVSADPSPELM